MLENLLKNFLQTFTESNALNIIRFCRCSNLFNIGIMLSQYFNNFFSNSIYIKDETAIIYYYLNNYDKSYTIYNKLLKQNLDEKESKQFLFNQHFSISHIADKYINYNLEKVQEIYKQQNNLPFITFTITTCKRIDLFQKTINSFINCCQDLYLITDWICVDDNSSEEDKQKMKELYPFFKFIWKNKQDKGHPKSMNIIRQNINSPYFFHLEDDFKFFAKKKYLTECLDVLYSNSKIGQCLINKNYTETHTDINVLGGEFHKTNNNLRYYIHEHPKTNEELQKWVQKHGTGMSSNYWPHYSFRPSLVRTQILYELGEFNENISHFEMEYANRYENKGYISAFLEGIYCIHIGRLTSERNDVTKTNAYELNNENQFSHKENQLKIKNIVINLDRRNDRYEQFKQKSKNIDCERFSAIDGKLLKGTEQLQIIFDNNDYNMRAGMVGCAMSHIKIYIELINSTYDAYCIFEDDIDFTNNFNKKFIHLLNQLQNKDWDLVYLGHHLKHIDKNKDCYDKEKLPTIEKYSVQKSFNESLGGTGGYIISKKGAEKLLEFINITGMTNGIDTVQQKACDVLNIYYSKPHLIFAECWRGDNSIDTDIQFNHDYLQENIDKRLENEINYFNNNINEINDYLIFKNIIQVENLNSTFDAFYHKNLNKENINQLKKLCIHPYYTLNDQVMIITPNQKYENKFYHRFKINNIWNIENALEII